jgi:cobalamin-dependent methionine synthase I
MCKPWWIHSAPSNMRITFDAITVDDIRAEKKIQLIKKKTGINPTNTYHGSAAFQPKATDVLKIMEELAKDKKRYPKLEKFMKKEKTQKKKTENAANEAVSNCHSEVEQSEVSVQTNASVQTSQRTVAPSEAIFQAFKDLSETSGVGRTVEITEAFGELKLLFFNRRILND